MTQPAKVQEPSMEEILASIRRIIADDEAKPAEKTASPAASASSASSGAAPPAAKPAVMTDIPPSAIAAAQGETGKGAGIRRLPPATARTISTPCWPGSMPQRPRRKSGRRCRTARCSNSPTRWRCRTRSRRRSVRLSPRTTSNSARPSQPARRRVPSIASPHSSRRRSTRALSRRRQQILSRSTVSAVELAFNTLANTVLSNNARTLEDLVKEMLRPMLKSWLDDNLPGLVERIVKAEIERVSRGR